MYIRGYMYLCTICFYLCDYLYLSKKDKSDIVISQITLHSLWEL